MGQNLVVPEAQMDGTEEPLERYRPDGKLGTNQIIG
jgi:hypothetical protein